MTLQVFTASLLKEGLVAYLCRENGNAYWSTDLTKAATANDKELNALQLEAERAEMENIVVAPYAVEVEILEGRIVPTTPRERIRANGPTILIPTTISDTEITGLHAA